MAAPTTAEPPDDIRVGILGPLEVRRAGLVVALGGRQQRAVLALLALDCGRVVSVDRIADELWGERLPPGYVTTLQTYVFHLREVLEPDRAKGAQARVLVSAPGGYRLVLPDDAVDVARFDEGATRGRAALEAHDPETAAAALSAALALWRGDVLADLSDLPAVQSVAHRLGEARLAASEDLSVAELALGHHAALVPSLASLAQSNPLRERLSALRMLALYRSGRQADALAVYQETRRRLDEQLGVEPGPELRQLHQQILRQDPSLGPESGLDVTQTLAVARGNVAPAGEPDVPTHDAGDGADSGVPRRRRWRTSPLLRHRVAVGMVVALAAVGVAGGVVWARRNQPIQPVPPNSVGAIGGHGLIGDAVSTNGAPVALVESSGSVWVLNEAEQALVRVNPESRDVTQTVPDVGDDPRALAASGKDIWVADYGNRGLVRVNTVAQKVVARVTVGNQPAAVVATPSAVWVANSGDNTIQRVDPTTGEPDAPIAVGDGPSALHLDGNTLWVANGRNATVSQIDTRNGGQAAADIPVDSGPIALDVTDTDVWVANSLSQTVSRIDRSSGRVSRIAVADGPTSIVATDDGVWVSNTFAGLVSRIDPQGNAVATVNVESSPHGLAKVGEDVWLASGPFASSAHVGGTLTVAMPKSLAFTTTDPAAAYPPAIVQALAPVYDGLVTLSHTEEAPPGTILPNLATEIPLAVDGGKTFVFTIRAGVRYSDGRPVLASDFARGFRRAVLGDGAPEEFSAVVGAENCIKNADNPALCDLSAGVVHNNDKRLLTFHLTRNDPNFIRKLAILVVPAPEGTPDEDVGRTPIPATGPYQVGALEPDGTLTLVRNPYFVPWSVAAEPRGYPDEIRFRVTADEASAVADVLSGAADLTQSFARFDLVSTIPTRAWVSAEQNTDFIYLNSSLPPFDRQDVRQALNYAIDRLTLVGAYPGGPNAAEPTCQMLPPNFPGYRPYCPFQLGPSNGRYSGPDLAKAQALVERSATRHIPITVHRYLGFDRSYAKFPDVVASVLRALGYTVTIEDIELGAADGDPSSDLYRSFQILGQAGWIADYPDPWTFFHYLADCNKANYNQFCDQGINALAAEATAVANSDPNRALEIWTQVDHRLTDAAVFLAIGNHKRLDIVSERVGNVRRDPAGPLLSQLWVK